MTDDASCPDPWTTTTMYPKHEIRAVWLATIMGLDWPRTKAKDEQSIEAQKEELRSILNQLGSLTL